MAGQAKLLGMNHVALEVGDLEAALELYGSLFEFELRGRAPSMAFLDMGDQFVALREGRTQGPDVHRHVGLVVDDVEAVRTASSDAGLETTTSPGGGVDLRDPWGNLIQVVAYTEVQFDRVPGVKRKLGIQGLEKSARARKEIEEHGLGGGA